MQGQLQARAQTARQGKRLAWPLCCSGGLTVQPAAAAAGRPGFHGLGFRVRTSQCCAHSCRKRARKLHAALSSSAPSCRRTARSSTRHV